MNERKNKTHLAMLSGGRDSTAMTLMILEQGLPLDYIVFCDTGIEHDAMYEYIDKLDSFFKRKYGIKITRLKPKHTFDEYIREPRAKGEYVGKTRGTPAFLDMCFWRRESKQYPYERWLKSLSIKLEDTVQYVGFVYGEQSRVEAMPKYCEAPLYESGLKEIDVQRYLEENEMENPLYRDFNRTGCAICPKQGIKDKYVLWSKYPKIWEYMSKTEQELNADENKTGVYPRWHIDLFIEDMEKQFIKKQSQSTFEFEEEPVRDCFCKI
jgi:3'-phosphoadenosine 5'-phosphosulfate sulfotransferase (PAPS reductase)/FAD synthetase